MTRLYYELGQDDWYAAKPVLTEYGFCTARYKGLSYQLINTATDEVIFEGSSTAANLKRDIKAALEKIGAYFEIERRP